MRKGDVTADVPPARCDVLVVGSGAGGLSAAVTAASLGLNVIVVEKEAVFGGTTAWSGGWLWIPRNPLAVAAGIVEDAEAPRTYLRHELGPHYDETRVEAFLEQGPRMIDFFQGETAVMFIDGNAIPDFHCASPGAREGGRSVCAAPFDARELGPRFAQLRPPLDLISPWGMGIASGTELRHFLNAMRNWRSFAYVTRRVVWHMLDLVVHRRGMKRQRQCARRAARPIGVRPRRRLARVGASAPIADRGRAGGRRRRATRRRHRNSCESRCRARMRRLPP